MKVSQKLKHLKDLVKRDDRGYKGGVWYSLNAEGIEELHKFEVGQHVSKSIEEMTEQERRALLRDLEPLGMKLTFEKNLPVIDRKTGKPGEFTGFVVWKKKEPAAEKKE